MIFKILRIITSLFLIFAIKKQPYSYYILLRIIVFVTAGYSMYMSSKYKMKNWIWIFSIIAFIFNPIFPIYMNRETWILIDISASVVFFISLNFLPHKNYEKSNTEISKKD